MKDYGLVNFQTGLGFEWFDVIRIGDTLTSELALTTVSEGRGEKGRHAALLSSEASYWNQHGELVGTGWGEATMTPFARGEEMLVERDLYQYSDQEIRQLASLVSFSGVPSHFWRNIFSHNDRVENIVEE